MAVIINDFEIVLDASAASAPAPAAGSTRGGAEPGAPGQMPLTPLDLEAVEQQREQRKLRLRAH